MTKHFLKILLLLFWCNTSFAQLFNFSSDDTLQNSRFIKTDFYNDFNSANLNSIIRINTNYKKFRFDFYNNLNSQITKLGDNFINDYNNLEAKTTFAVYKNFYAGAGIGSKVLSGNQSLSLNKGQNNFFYSAFDYYPSDNFYVLSKFGIRDEKQVGVHNTGYSGSIYSQLDRYKLSDFYASGSVRMYLDKYSEKTNYAYEINSYISRQFSSNAYNEGILRAFTYRTDFYTPASQSIRNEFNVDNNIQSRIENYFMLNDKLDYKISENFAAKLSGLFYTKNINNLYKYKPSRNILLENVYDYNINENFLQIGGGLDYTSQSLQAKFNAMYIERDEIHSPKNTGGLSPQQLSELQRIEEDKNNNSRTSTAFLEFIYILTQKHKIRFQGVSSLLRYDTNSKLNFDDRDELYMTGSISYLFSNLTNFLMETTFEINNSQLNYIFKEKSANNYTNKVYKLTTVNSFTPYEFISTKNFFQVLANYTVYKYHNIVTQVQNFSLRQLYLSDSTNIRLTKNISNLLYGELKAYEQGQFNDEHFSVNPIAYYNERKLGTTLNYEFKKFMNIFAGYRHYQRRYYKYDKNEPVLQRTQYVYGPYVGIDFIIKNNSFIYIMGGIDKVEASDSGESMNSNNLVIKVLWNI